MTPPAGIERQLQSNLDLDKSHPRVNPQVPTGHRGLHKGFQQYPLQS